MLAAISLLLVYLIHFPIFPGAAFLEYDMADVPILIATFLFGLGLAAYRCCQPSAVAFDIAGQRMGWICHALYRNRVVRAYRRLYLPA
jgi:riboflavin transporter FmnP